MSAPVMRAAIVGEDGEPAGVTMARPEPGAGEVRVDVAACGVCGSDLHARRRKHWPPGLVPGHEIAGRLGAFGPDCETTAVAQGLEIGGLVVVEPLWTCGDCAACRAGRDSICPSLAIAGVHRPGGFAESLVMPASRVHAVDADLDPVVATLCEPLAVALHAIDRIGGVAGERVLVLGGGTLGLLCALGAAEGGAAEVVVRARHPHQARWAREVIGATSSDARRSIAAEGQSNAFDVAFETVGGASETLLEAGVALRPGGRIAVLGLFDEAPRLDPTVALAKELTLHWSNCYARPPERASDFARAIRIVAEHHTELRHLVTDRVPLGDIRDAFDKAARKQEGAGRVVVVV